MTRALLVRSITLSHSTANAWRLAGGMFARRNRPLGTIPDVAFGRPIINLGNNAYNPDVHAVMTWNKPELVEPLLSPSKTRDLLNGLLPSNEYTVLNDKYWLKGPGRGGRNKELITVSGEGDFSWRKRMLPAKWDIQQHIVGDEYRFITVSNKVVQVARRLGENGDRSYQWIGVANAPRFTIPLVKRAVNGLVPDINPRTIIGWDVIMDSSGIPYILEGNACPGVNEATANRILDAVISNEIERGNNV